MLTPSPPLIPAQFTALPSSEIPLPWQLSSVYFTPCLFLGRHCSAALSLSEMLHQGIWESHRPGLLHELTVALKGSALRFPEFFCRPRSSLIWSSQHTVIPTVFNSDVPPSPSPSITSSALGTVSDCTADLERLLTSQGTLYSQNRSQEFTSLRRHSQISRRESFYKSPNSIAINKCY